MANLLTPQTSVQVNTGQKGQELDQMIGYLQQMLQAKAQGEDRKYQLGQRERLLGAQSQEDAMLEDQRNKLRETWGADKGEFIKSLPPQYANEALQNQYAETLMRNGFSVQELNEGIVSGRVNPAMSKELLPLAKDYVSQSDVAVSISERLGKDITTYDQFNKAIAEAGGDPKSMKYLWDEFQQERKDSRLLAEASKEKPDPVAKANEANAKELMRTLEIFGNSVKGYESLVDTNPNELVRINAEVKKARDHMKTLERDIPKDIRKNAISIKGDKLILRNIAGSDIYIDVNAKNEKDMIYSLDANGKKIDLTANQRKAIYGMDRKKVVDYYNSRGLYREAVKNAKAQLDDLAKVNSGKTAGKALEGMY